MYKQHFGLSCRPFDLAPDPHFLYLTKQHSRAVANMTFALTNRDNFVIITGEIGIGKTTVINTVVENLGPEFVIAKLSHTTLSDIELLQSLLSAFGIPIYKNKKVLLLDTLRAYFLEQHKKGKFVVIIVDEAQNLNMEALEELRLLSCIDSSDRKILSIVLAGQPALDDLLDSPKLAQLRQRARLRQKLDALSETETLDYVHHRLQVAGGDSTDIFEPDVLKEVHRLTFGIPRLINTLCDTALTSCFVDNQSEVTLDVIDSVIQELKWQWLEEHREQENTAESPRTDATDGILLMVYRAGQFVEQTHAKHFPFVIGRSNANDLAIIDKEVSRRHALIDCIGGIYVIEDLNSKNGMLINRKLRSRTLLRSGDTITLGQVDIVFHQQNLASDDADPNFDPQATVASGMPMDHDEDSTEDDTGQHQANITKISG